MQKEQPPTTTTTIIPLTEDTEEYAVNVDKPIKPLSIISMHHHCWTSMLVSGYIRDKWIKLNINNASFLSQDILILIRSFCIFSEKIDRENFEREKY